MLRCLLLMVSALALTACDSFKDYRVRVDDPSRQSDIRTRESPYYDYKKKETIYPR